MSENDGSMRQGGQRRPPLWFVLLIVVALVPMFSFPAFIGASPSGDDMLKTLAWMFPVAMAGAAFYSWVSYGPRRDVAWLMLVFMFLIDAAMFYLYILAPEIGS